MSKTVVMPDRSADGARWWWHLPHVGSQAGDIVPALAAARDAMR